MTITIVLLLSLAAVVGGLLVITGLPSVSVQRVLRHLQRTVDRLESDYQLRRATLDARGELARWQQPGDDPAEPRG
jgi:hypothetical protein